MRLERVIGSSVPRTAAQENVAPNLLTHAVIWRSKSQDAKLFTPTLTAPYAPSLPGTGYGRGRGYATSQITNKRHPGAENGKSVSRRAGVRRKRVASLSRLVPREFVY